MGKRSLRRLAPLLLCAFVVVMGWLQKSRTTARHGPASAPRPPATRGERPVFPPTAPRPRAGEATAGERAPVDPPRGRPRRERPTLTVTEAHARQARDVRVEGVGTVVKLLPDDRSGSRHQRFLLRIYAGPTVLVAHNIDLAARVEPLRVGDEVSFAGEYVWSAKGGVLHWTHRDPDGRHRAGWLEVSGQRFE